MKTFYVVYNIQSDKPITRRFEHKSAAEGACRHMAERYPGETFYVMQALIAYSKQDITRTELDVTP